MTDTKETASNEAPSLDNYIDGLFPEDKTGETNTQAENTEEVKPESEETEGETTPEDNSEETPEDPKITEFEKRLQDTQKWGNEAHQKNQALMKRLKEEFDWTDDEIAKYSAGNDLKEQADEFAKRINTELDTAKEIYAEATGKTDEELEEAIAAFDAIATIDRELHRELMAVPAHKQAMFILRKGEELKDIGQELKKHKSVASAFKELSDLSDSKIKEAEKRGYAQAKKELEEKYADYVLPNGSRPKLESSAKSSAKTKAEDENKIDNNFVASVFGR